LIAAISSAVNLELAASGAAAVSSAFLGSSVVVLGSFPLFSSTNFLIWSIC
jgi:hypothetical protein